MVHVIKINKQVWLCTAYHVQACISQVALRCMCRRYDRSIDARGCSTSAKHSSCHQHMVTPSSPASRTTSAPPAHATSAPPAHATARHPTPSSPPRLTGCRWMQWCSCCQRSCETTPAPQQSTTCCSTAQAAARASPSPAFAATWWGSLMAQAGPSTQCWWSMTGSSWTSS
jgi:hypothetical protein